MSFDRMQKAIRKAKSPLALQLGCGVEDLPPQLTKAAFDQYGETLEGAAHALLAFDLGLLEALSGLVPAVLLPVSFYEALGWRGLQVLEQVIAAAREKGFFVIADAKVGEVGSAASLAAQSWLGTVPVGSNTQQGVFGADCLTVSGYAGSEAISPVLETCLAQDKCFFTLVKTPNPSGGEVQGLVAGDRVVYQVVGDLNRRLGQDSVGQMGYSRAGAMVGTTFPSDLRALRKRLPDTFFLVSGLTPEDAQLAFDRYGRGAILDDGGALQTAWKTTGQEGADYQEAAQKAAISLRDEVKHYVTLL